MPSSIPKVALAVGALAAVVVAAVVLTPASAERIIDVDAPRPGDEQSRRTFTLDNGIEVLLVSDPKFTKSAVALAVEVGSMQDPMEHMGMAHFLEHMLFLGTEKYPGVDDYSKYLSDHQGSDNAYTSVEHTNYFFDVNHDALEGGIDRFAQFFIAPLFTPQYVEREMNAVHSEHQKNVQTDGWRQWVIFKMLHREDHEMHSYSTGNLETLKNVTQEELKAFYRSYYSANVMKLSVLGLEDLDTLEGWVRTYFAAVPNHERGKLTYSDDLFEEGALPMFVQVEPVADVRELSIQFQTPELNQHYRTKPQRLLASLVGHEGEGSLLSKLKEENLATALSAHGSTFSYAGFFETSITLTEKGLANVDRVTELFFSYVAMLRKEGLKEYYFRETQTMADLDYFYRDHEEGMGTAAGYASSMIDFPASEFQENERLLYDYGPEVFATFVDLMRPERAIVTLTAKGVETNETEPYFGAEFSRMRIADEKIKAWKSVAPDPTFTYPEPNAFIPDDLALLENDSKSEPYRLVDDERGFVWFEQDKKFKLPKGRVELLLQSNQANASPRDRLLTTLYVRSVREGLNEWNYPVLEAGLSARVDDSWRGVQLSFDGYSQRIPDLMESFAERITKVDISQDTFEAIKDELSREYANGDVAQAYSQVFEELQYLQDPAVYHRRDYADLVGEVTLEQVKRFGEKLFGACAIEGVAYGNLDGKRLARAVDGVFSSVARGVLAEDLRPESRTVTLPAGEPVARVFSTRADNNCWYRMVQFGERNHRREAALRVGAALVERPFYTEMRTNQQLGYIVWSFASLSRDGQGMQFLIQSGTYPAAELADRANALLAQQLDSLADTPVEEFETVRAAIVEELEQEDKEISERISRIRYEGIDLGGDFAHRRHVIEELKALTPAEVAAAFREAWSAESIATLCVYLDAEGKEASKPKERLLTDLRAFKERPVFERTALRMAAAAP